MKKYYYLDGKEQFGPCSFEELKNKNIKAETLIWFEGLEEWTLAKNIQEIKEFLEVTPPHLIPTDVAEIDSTMPPEIKVSISSEYDYNSDSFLDELSENIVIPQKKKINKSLANILIVIASFVFYFIWAVLFAVLERFIFDWKVGSNGGAIYSVIKVAILIICLGAIWKKIKSYSK